MTPDGVRTLKDLERFYDTQIEEMQDIADIPDGRKGLSAYKCLQNGVGGDLANIKHLTGALQNCPRSSLRRGSISA